MKKFMCFFIKVGDPRKMTTIIYSKLSLWETQELENHACYPGLLHGKTNTGCLKRRWVVFETG